MADAEEEEITRIPPEGKRGGKWVPIGDEAYRVPPLGFRSVQELEEDIAGLAKVGARPTAAQMGVMAKIVHAAMLRNYPRITLEEVDGMLDLGNYQDVLGAVLAVAGFKKGGAAPGEPPPAAGTQLTAP